MVRQNLIEVLLFLTIAGCGTHTEPTFVCEEPCLKIVTYNVNFGFVNPQNVVDYLAGSNADIICLQETHKYWEATLKTHLSKQYQYFEFRDWPGAGGIAIMSKYELNNAILIEPSDGWFPALLADVKTPLGYVQCLNVHLRPPLSDMGSVSASAYYQAPEIHLNELQNFIAKADANRPLIIAGDFNENENKKAIQWLFEQGFTDALSTYDTYSKTWKWKTSVGVTLKNRYDHILFNKDLNCIGALVEQVEASDHLPVFAIVVSKKSELSPE